MPKPLAAIASAASSGASDSARKPALINVDLANAWTRPGNPFTCERIDDQVIPADAEASRRVPQARLSRGACDHLLPGYRPQQPEYRHGALALTRSRSRPWPRATAICGQIDSRIAPIAGRAAPHQEACERLSRDLSRRLLARRGRGHHRRYRRHCIGLRARDGMRRPRRRLPDRSWRRRRSAIASRARCCGISSTSTPSSAMSRRSKAVLQYLDRIAKTFT